jgi:hypothetical protein
MHGVYARGIHLDLTRRHDAERILETPALNLKGREVRDICSVVDAYDDLIRPEILKQLGLS